MNPDRVLPHSLEAERSVLGAILIDNEAYPFAAEVVDSSAFYRDAHRRIWRAIVALAEAHEPIDALTLKEALHRAGDLEEIGGPSYLAALLDGVPRATNVEYYAGIVRDKATLRALILSANKITNDAYEEGKPADQLVDEAEALMMAVGQRTVRSEFILSDDWAVDLRRAIERACEVRQLVTGVKTGLGKLDRFTRGLQPSDLIYIGARPSTGKTSLMLQMALAASDSVLAGIVSVEMARRVIGLRAVAMEAHVDLFRLMTGYLSDEEQIRVGRALALIGMRKIAIDDASGITAAQLRAKVRRLASRHGLGIVFVDYIQLLHGSRNYENRNLELSEISASLKGLAKELNIPVVVLSQLSRSTTKENRKPQLSDLRDSGSLEADADVVLLLHRPQQHDLGQRYGEGEEAELIIAKQRNGPTGTIKLHWIGDQARFGEAVDTEHAQPAQQALV